MKNLNFVFLIIFSLLSPNGFAADAVEEKKLEIFGLVSQITNYVNVTDNYEQLNSLAETLSESLNMIEIGATSICKELATKNGYPAILAESECVAIDSFSELSCLKAGLKLNYPVSLTLSECKNISSIPAQCVSISVQASYPFSLALSECGYIKTSTQLNCLKTKVDSSYPVSLALSDCK